MSCGEDAELAFGAEGHEEKPLEGGPTFAWRRRFVETRSAAIVSVTGAGMLKLRHAPLPDRQEGSTAADGDLDHFTAEIGWVAAADQTGVARNSSRDMSSRSICRARMATASIGTCTRGPPHPNNRPRLTMSRILPSGVRTTWRT